jgi:hypothetical protein
MMGAGFGGSILALLEAGAEEAFRGALPGVPVRFCLTADGAYVHSGRGGPRVVEETFG